MFTKALLLLRSLCARSLCAFSNAKNPNNRTLFATKSKKCFPFGIGFAWAYCALFINISKDTCSIPRINWRKENGKKWGTQKKNLHTQSVGKFWSWQRATRVKRHTLELYVHIVYIHFNENFNRSMLDSMHGPCISIAANAKPYCFTVRVRNTSMLMVEIDAVRFSIALLCVLFFVRFVGFVSFLKRFFCSLSSSSFFLCIFRCLRFRVTQNFSICLVLMMAVQQDRPI